MKTHRHLLIIMSISLAMLGSLPLAAQQCDVSVNSSVQFDIHFGTGPAYYGHHCPGCRATPPPPWRGPVPHHKSKHYKAYKKWYKEQQKWEKQHRHHFKKHDKNHKARRRR